MYYRNQDVYNEAQVAFYEIFRRHTSTDPRDCGASWEYVLGTVDSVPDAEDRCMELQAHHDRLTELAKGYTSVWEDFEDICPYTKQPRKGRRSTGRWVDEFGYQDALAEFRKIDPTYYGGDRPEYLYRAIRKMPNLTQIR